MFELTRDDLLTIDGGSVIGAIGYGLSTVALGLTAEACAVSTPATGGWGIAGAAITGSGAVYCAGKTVENILN